MRVDGAKSGMPMSLASFASTLIVTIKSIHFRLFPATRISRPSLAKILPPARAWGTPGVQCTRSLAWDKK